MRKPTDAIAESRALADEIKELEQELAEVESRIDELLAALPNLPDPSVPDGATEEDAELVRTVGEPPGFDFEPRDHLEIGTALDLIDMESAARASGSRFAYLKGELVMLELALVQYAMSKLSGSRLPPGGPAGAGPGGADVLDGLPARPTARRSTRSRATTCSWSAPPR